VGINKTKHISISQLRVYNERGVTARSLAASLGLSTPTLKKLLLAAGIPIKTPQQTNAETTATMPSREELVDCYSRMSLRNLALHFKAAPTLVSQWIDHYGIPRLSQPERCVQGKTRQNSHKVIDKVTFQRLYTEAGSLTGLSQSTGLSMNWLRCLRSRYGIDLIPTNKRSTPERNLCDHLTDQGITIEICDRTIIAPLELDVVIPDKKLAIEVSGTVWHSESFGSKPRSYHRSKWIHCRNAGHDLLTLWAHEISSHAVLQLVSKKAGVSQAKVGARLTAIRPISTKVAKTFDSVNHVMGFRPASVYLGLFSRDGILLQTMSFGKSRHNGNFEYEMIRATSGPTTVVGGLSKLYKYFVSNYDPASVITYADLRFGEGQSYSHLGFNRQADSAPNYFYYHRSNPEVLFSRVKFQKHKLQAMLDIFDPKLSEWENMQANGYDRIWDCGNAVWTWNK
jgi:hypothetical protein